MMLMAAGIANASLNHHEKEEYEHRDLVSDHHDHDQHYSHYEYPTERSESHHYESEHHYPVHHDHDDYYHHEI